MSDHIYFAFTVNVEEMPSIIANNHITNKAAIVKLDRSTFLEDPLLACSSNTHCSGTTEGGCAKKNPS